MGGVASVFERSLQAEISLSFFLPLVVYMSDAVGTQTETLLIRRMAARKVSAVREIVLETGTGFLSARSSDSWLCWHYIYGPVNPFSRMIVGLAVLASAITAAVIASCLPLLLSAMKADPAAASGPVATVIQDFLSVTIYLGIASLLLI